MWRNIMVSTNLEKGLRSTANSLLAVVLLLVFTVSVQAQVSPQWVRIFGGPLEDYGKAVIATQDGGLATTGITKSFGEPEGDLMLVKSGSLGFYEWGVTFGRNSLEKGKEILQTADGGYVIAGYSFSYGSGPGDREAFVMKTDQVGAQVWANVFGGTGIDTAFDIVPVNGGGFFVAGDYQLENSARNTYLLLLDENGDTIWEQILGGESVDERTFTGCQLTNGNFVFGGNIRHAVGEDTDLHIGCVDPSGTLLWEHEFGGDGDDIVRRIRPLPTGGFVLAGETELFPISPGPHCDLYVAKFTEDGDSVWTSLIGTTGDEECNGLDLDSDGDIVIAGSTKGGFGDSWDLYIVKADTLGNTQWTWSFQTPNLEFGKGIVERVPGEYVVTGKTTYQTDVAGSMFLLSLAETEVVADATWEELATYESMTPTLSSQETSITIAPMASGWTLHPVMPNPTNAGAIISMTIPQTGLVQATVYNSLGREVAVLNNGTLTAGTHQFAFMGNELASGVYFVRAVVPGQMNEVQRITIVR
jgi:hypothetical protein